MTNSKTWSPLSIVREYFPDIDIDTANHILWNNTGYPSFWSGPDPEVCMREQLQSLKDKLDGGMTLAEVNDEYDKECARIAEDYPRPKRPPANPEAEPPTSPETEESEPS